MKPYSLLLIVFLYTLGFGAKKDDVQNNFLSFETIKKEEKGLKRDFLINEFLKQKSTTENQAYESLKYIDSMNDQLLTNFAIKYKHDETLAVIQCMKMPINQLLSSYADCIKLGLNYKEASFLNPLQINQLSNITSNKYPTFAKKLKVLSSAIPFTKIITLDSDSFYELYFNLPTDFKQRYFNYKLPRKTFFRINKDKINFEKYLKENITNRSFDIVNGSFLAMDDTHLTYNASFLLGLNAFEFNNMDKAKLFLQNALIKADEKKLNQVLFWLYKTTKNRSYLRDILLNNSTDLYTILAKEVLNENHKLEYKHISNKEFIENTKELSIKNQAFLYSLIKITSNFDKKFISKEFKVGVLSQDYTLEDIESFYKNGLAMKKSISLIKKGLLKDEDTNVLLKYLKVNNKNDSLNLLKNNFMLNEKIDKILAFEFISDDKLEKFLLNYYFYINNNLKDKKKEFKLFSIFESLN